MNYIKGYYVLILLQLIGTTAVFSQKIIDKEADKIIYKAPNSNFNDISLQAYNGLVRFGILNDFDISEPKKSQSYFAYRDMIVFKQNQEEGWDSSFKDPEKIDLYANYNGDAKGGRARDMLTSLFPNNLSGTGKVKYFGSERTRAFGLMAWSGESKFAKKRIFKSFVTENLKDLKKWSNNFLPMGEEEAYYVTLSNVIYNFENQGLLISLDYWNLENEYKLSVEKILNTHELNFKKHFKRMFSGARLTPESSTVLGDLIYKPRTNYERNLSSEAFVVFYEISPEKANPILQEGGVVYIVRKIKFYKDFTFNIASPIIELYKDKALTQKIGELDYNDLIFY